ncbi:beta strand repeat-containing protein [Stieleria varia]|nr:hypothetical protein [Stieleria varia]
MLEGLEDRNLLAAITVDTLLDVVNPGDGLTSLREAVIQSNTNGEADTITLPVGTLALTLSGAGEDVAASGDLDITEANMVTLTGSGSGSTVIDASGLSDRAFDILAGGMVSLNGLSITGGVASDTGGAAPSSVGDGGAIFTAGTLSLNDVTLSGNTAAGAAGSGGGILNLGILNVLDSSIINNTANRAGGGIEDASNQSVTLDNVALDGNNAGVGPAATAAPGNGGGLHVTGNADVTITGGTVSNNVAAREGGGLWNGNGLMTIDGTVIAGNVASGAASHDGGGGIFNNGGDLDIDNVLIDSNEADGAAGSGGGILSIDGTITIDASIIRFNSANRAGGGIEAIEGDITLQNSTNLIQNDVNGLGLSANTPAPGNGGAIHITGSADVTLIGGTVDGNEARSEGGGLWNASGTMTIDGTTIVNNFVESAGAAGDAQGGGGIFNNGGSLIILNGATIEANEALDPDGGATNDDGGGGIFNNGGIVSITDSTVTGNFASDGLGNGGGILSLGGSLTVMGGVVSANAAARAGGGIESIDSTLMLTNVQIGGVDASDGNTAGINGGGVHVSGNGNSTITGGTVQNNTAQREGGGLWNNTGVMTINGATIVDNVANGPAADDGGGGVFNNGGTLRINAGTDIQRNAATGASGSGGGIFNNLGGVVQIVGATLEANTANRAGGGIEDASGPNFGLFLTDVILDGNSAGVDIGQGAVANPGNGGGLHVTGAGGVFITGGQVINNSAAREGGGLWNGTGLMRLDGTLVEGNVASGAMADDGGGGIFNNGGTLQVRNASINNNDADGTLGSGGGIFSTDGSVNVSNTTITGNSATRAGGGIEIVDGQFILSNVTLGATGSGNTAGINGGGLHVTGTANTIVVNSAVAGNSAAREGGGLWNSTGRMSISNTDILDNIASGAGSDDGGGGIFNNGGTLSIIGGSLMNNEADGDAGSGGAIFNNTGGTIMVRDATISNNLANRAGGGIEDASNVSATKAIQLIGVTLSQNRVFGLSSSPTTAGNGAGLHVSGSGFVTVSDSMITENVASGEGGGLWNGTGRMDLFRNMIDGNTASGNGSDQGGGGVFNSGGVITLFGGSISDNVADGTSGSGGGVLNDVGGRMVFNAVSITGNSANRAGGGIEDNSGAGLGIVVRGGALSSNEVGSSPGNGGGLHITGSGDATIQSVVIEGNTASAEGGGLWNGTGTLTVQGSTLSNNVASGSIAADEGGGAIFNNGGTLVVTGQNSFSQNSDAGLGDDILSVGGSANIHDNSFASGTNAIGIVGSETFIQRNQFSGYSNDVIVYGTSGADTFDVVGNSIAVGGVVVRASGVGRLAIDGRDGADTFNVQPNVDTVFAIMGGDPSTEPGDTLNVLAAASSAATLDDNGDGTGSFTFADRADIEFSEIESAMLI